MAYFSMHNHSSYSNLKGLDAIIRLDEMIQYANDIGLHGICLSEHDVLSSHYKFLKEYKKLKKEDKIRNDFKIGLGNEIYLVMEDNLEELKEKAKNRETKFYHFLLLARNKEGHKQLRQLSSLAWGDMFSLYGMERVPTFKHNLKSIIKQGDVIGTTACAGSYIGQTIIKQSLVETVEEQEQCEQDISNFIAFCIDVFGADYFFLELQPSNNPEQILINQKLIELSQIHNLKYTIATDGHYLKKEDRDAHRTYLQSQNMEREVDAFYEATFIQSEQEIKEYLTPYLSDEQIQIGFDTTIEIMNIIEDYSLDRDTVVPTPEIPQYDFEHILEQGYTQYPYIEKFAYSKFDIDRYYLHLVQKGLIEKIFEGRQSDKEYFHVCLNRIDTELKEIWNISEKIHERVSAYYVLVKEIVDITWTDGDSLVGVSRGSAGGYLTVYLLGITQMNPLDYNLPHYRHLTAERPELPDIDLDSEQRKRGKILEALKKKYGYNKVLNIATFSTEGSRSALLSAARGMGLDIDSVGYLTSLIPNERGFTWSLSDCYYGNEKKKRAPITELVNAVNQYEGLMKNSLKIEGLIKARSVHASGIYIFNDDFTEMNAMMRAPSGQPITQFDMKDSDAQGALKVDALTVQGLDRIRCAMDSLIEYGFIDFQDDLQSTYDTYLHPDVLEYEDNIMWEKVGNNEIPDLFQFDTSVGLQCAKKTRPTSIPELSAANSLMRLMAEDGKEQPMDKYVRFKEDISLWYEEMDDYNLTDNEIQTLEKHLLPVYGVGESQEILMELSMDAKISNFTMVESNDLRKIVGKKLMEEIPRIQNLFFDKGIASGNSQNILQYVWDAQILPQLGYSFSSIHSTGYSLMALQEMNIATKYPSIIWSTACLTVSANASEDEEFTEQQEEDGAKKTKATNYDKVASSIGKMRSHNVVVALPDINKASFSFTPDLEKNQIIYGLKGVSGLNNDIVKIVIDNRPYKSFEDFHERLYCNGLIGYDESGQEIRGKLLQKKHMISLIKAGAFNSFDTPIEIMKLFVFHEVDKKTTLNMQNIKSIIRLGLLESPEYSKYLEVMQLRDDLRKKKVDKETMDSLSVNYKLTKADKCYIIAPKLYEQYQKFFPENGALLEYSSNGIIISDKRFDKEYQKFIEPLKEIITSTEFVREFNIAQFYEIWDDIAQGTVEKWEMDSVVYYSDKHELDGVDNAKYNISNYTEISPIPEVIERYTYRGREQEKYKVFTLIGTCIGKNKDKHTFTLLTPDGVVTCKTYAGAYAHYDKTISRKGAGGKKETIEKSWFTRGNLLMVKGFRREDQFVLRTNAVKGQEKEHTIKLIWGVEENGELILQNERAQS